MTDDFRPKVKSFAERMVALAPRCNNEESTKLFLVLPFLNFLGYDDRNPDEVCPEHGADFSEKYKNRVDFAILKSGQPVIAIECKTLGMALTHLIHRIAAIRWRVSCKALIAFTELGVKAIQFT